MPSPNNKMIPERRELEVFRILVGMFSWGSFAWDRSLVNFGLGSLVWEPSLGNLRFAIYPILFH